MNLAAKRRVKTALLLIALTIAVIWTLFPFYWSIVTSLKTQDQILAKPVTYFPNSLNFDNYRKAWDTAGFSYYFLNSVYVALISMAFTVLFSTMAGYALSRFKFKMKPAFMLLLLCTQFVPSSMLIIPLFMTFNTVSLINDHWSLIIVYTTFHIPFNAILMRSFISAIPVSLEEAARVDGCNRRQAVLRVILPALLPGIAAISAYSFISSWNEYLYALMFMTSDSKYTIPVGLSMMIGEYNIAYGQLAAGSVIALTPIVFLFGYVQRYMVSGLTAGAVKG